ncbi:uncharacterized protein LOC125894172 isoform X1 [Epinephelus fuscoguttatus]|uniref:uncharacterized protein LOC125894172 isoform X1 n=2 Tax=Epinephelus fuscoguttatus TaxID=293821 RepID=UPI0020CFFD50|nr:uncharacterized protein LOC125894172 isoform X1 [Epinephelus fuscoguttatus]
MKHNSTVRYKMKINTADMLLLHATVLCILYGSSAGLKHKTVCYGKNYEIPFSYAPPLFHGPLYFTPNGGSRRLMMDNGEAKDPRFKVSYISAVFKDLTERDDGFFSVSDDNGMFHDVIKLEILDCAEKETRYYGDRFSYHIPREAAFLEFTPLDSEDQPKVLWNHTNRHTNRGGRGQVKGNVWEIMNVNQGDMGHYNFRRKDNTLLLRIQLTVQEGFRQYDTKVDKRLLIQNPLGDVPMTVTFTPEGEMKHYTLMKAGLLVEDEMDSMPWTFTRRILVVQDGIEIDPVESTDSGTYEFRDPQGHLALTAQVVVKRVVISPAVGYGTSIFGILFAGIICRCCVKSCSKESSSKRNKSAPRTAGAHARAPAPAPAVYSHDSDRSGGPIYSAAPGSGYSHQPLNSGGRTSILTEPMVHNPLQIHVSSPQPEVDPLGVQTDDPAPTLGFDCLSSDPEPKFELKLPSAPPLSSDATFSDVYTSDKLNFL